MVNRSENHRSENRGLWLLLGLLAALSLSLFLIPAFVIRPFRYPSERALGLAIAVKRIAPALSLAALVGVLAAGLACVAELAEIVAVRHRNDAGAKRGGSNGTAFAGQHLELCRMCDQRADGGPVSGEDQFLEGLLVPLEEL
jgi:hypothetical protein